MRYREKFVGNKEEMHDQLKEIFSKLIRGTLEVEESTVKLPNDKMMELKVKYEDNLDEGQLAMKIVWSYLEEVAEEEEEVEL